MFGYAHFFPLASHTATNNQQKQLEKLLELTSKIINRLRNSKNPLSPAKRTDAETALLEHRDIFERALRDNPSMLLQQQQMLEAAITRINAVLAHRTEVSAPRI